MADLTVTDEGAIADSVSAYEDKEGWHYSRSHRCSFDQNVTDLNRDATLVAMTVAVGVDLYAVHATIGSIKCQRRTPKITSPRGGEVLLDYSRGVTVSFQVGEDPVLEVGSSLITSETNTDYQGNAIELTHTPTNMTAKEVKDSFPNSTGGVIRVGVMVPFEQPRHTIRISHLRNSSPEIDAMTFVGAVSSEAWKSGEAYTWRCSSIIGRSNDGGETYETTYEFEWRPYDNIMQGWEARVYIIDPSTGKPFPDLVEGVGKKWVAIQPLAAFAGLPI